MSVYKCKMCGGTLKIAEGQTVAECEYCGSTQTISKSKDEIVQNLFNRANHLRLQCEFDKAQEIYEKILDIDESDSEAHWGVVLCKYGIEYVKDDKTGKHIPTCHRAQYESILTDSDYLLAIENADATQQAVYANEAVSISKLQKDILSIVKNEKPFDIFICYKETDKNGSRTKDSVIANDIYYELKESGFKVFFAAITLEDKLGQEYEPYIFSALNSAKVMLVVGTKPEYFNSVWVKNEWARYLKLMKNDKSRTLIPCYRDMDAYDLPEEFSHLQAQDMSKIGFINDIVRGIKKLISDNEEKTKATQATVMQNNTAPLIERAFMFLEDGDFKSADEYCEKVLDINPKDATAYLGKLMVDLNVKKRAELENCSEPFDNYQNYQKAVRFGDEKLVTELKGYITHINERNENNRLTGIYDNAVNTMKSANTEDAYKSAAKDFKTILGFKDSDTLAEVCIKKAEVCRKDAIYNTALSTIQTTVNKVRAYESAIELFQTIPGWKDSDEQILDCQKKIEVIKAKEEADRLERERQAELEREKAEKRKKRNKKIAIITTPIVCVVIAFVIILNTVIIPNNRYNDAIALMEAGKYSEAIATFEETDGYKDSEDKIKECKYNTAVALMEAGKYQEVIATFEELDGYKDSEDKIKECKYNTAVALMEAGKYQEAISSFIMAKNYKDSSKQIKDIIKICKIPQTISEGSCHTVGLKSDGTVVAAGYNDEGQCDVQDWKDIIAISSGGYHTVGLKSDGAVVAAGYNDEGQCDVQDWKDIVAVSAGYRYTVGLKSDGTVVATEYTGDKEYYSGQCDVDGWKDIVAVSAGGYHTVGLKSDGTVVAVGYNEDGRCDVDGWKDIVAVSAGGYHTVGLKSDGTVVATGYNEYGQCDVDGWKDIVAVSAANDHTVGLKSDGTVVAVGTTLYSLCDVDGWKDIVAVSAGSFHTVGLKSDGTVVATGENDVESNVSKWKNIKIPE